MQHLVTLEELNPVLDVAPFMPMPSLELDDVDELLELAAECDPRGPLWTIKGLLEGLRTRHANDDATCAVLAALEHYNLPVLIDSAKDSQ